MKSKSYMLGTFSKSLIGGFLFGAAKHLYLLVTSKEYLKLSIYRLRYAFTQRYREIEIKCCHRQLSVPDAASFLSMYEEIYVNRIYQIPSEPLRILDLGANIGLSIMWFKQYYPESEIVAYEADANIFRHLQKNVAGLDGVTIHNEAVWHEDAELSFASEGADGGHIENAGEIDGNDLVQARDIRRVLKEKGPFNFIKMDIEGAEASVLPACRGLLEKTDFIFCEYHSIEGEGQNLDEILNVLCEEGFRIHIQPVSISKQPFMRRKNQVGFDMQLNIFGWRSQV